MLRTVGCSNGKQGDVDTKSVPIQKEVTIVNKNEYYGMVDLLFDLFIKNNIFLL